MLPRSFKLTNTWSSGVDRVIESVCTLYTDATDVSDALQQSIFRATDLLSHKIQLKRAGRGLRLYTGGGGGATPVWSADIPECSGTVVW
jgi:hypothetical protein